MCQVLIGVFQCDRRINKQSNLMNRICSLAGVEKLGRPYMHEYYYIVTGLT